MEPPNKGHFGSVTFVLYLEAVLWWEVQIITVSTIIISFGTIASVLYIEVVLWWEGPLQEAPLYFLLSELLKMIETTKTFRAIF